MGDDLGLSELAKSALLEVLNIAASHSANAVSDSIKSPVHILSPGFDTFTFKSISENMKNSVNRAVVVCGDLLGDISGSVILFFPLEKSPALLNMIIKSDEEVKEISKDNVQPIQEMGHLMLSSFAEAIASFFGANVASGNFFSGIGKVGLILNHLESRLNAGGGSSIFVNTNFSLDSTENICHLFLSLTQSDLDRLLGTEVPEFSDEFDSLTDMVDTFEELTNIESTINGYIENSQVPVAAKRSFLRSITPEAFEKDRMRNFISNILLASKVGERIEVIQKDPFAYEVTVKSCKVCDIFPTEGKKSCYTTATALGRFFLETLGIGNEVEEIKCVKIGDPACVYSLRLESIDVFSFMPNAVDVKILKSISEGTGDISEIVKRTTLSNEEVSRSISILKFYDILKVTGNTTALTETGRVLLNFAQAATSEEEEYQEGWDDIKAIEEKIHSSKAQGPIEVGFREAKLPWE